MFLDGTASGTWCLLCCRTDYPGGHSWCKPGKGPVFSFCPGYTVSVLGREEGYRSNIPLCLKEFPRANSWRWRGIFDRISHVKSWYGQYTILTVIKLINPSKVCILPRECTVKYTPRLEVILKELNLSIPSYLIYWAIRENIAPAARPIQRINSFDIALWGRTILKV